MTQPRLLARIFVAAAFLLLAGLAPLRAQTVLLNYSQWCQSGGILVNTSGSQSSTQVQGSFPFCTVTVYIHGTTTKADIYSDNIPSGLLPGHVLANPFTANADATFSFYADYSSDHYDVLMGGVLTPTMMLRDIALGSGQGGGGGGGGGTCPLCVQAVTATAPLTSSGGTTPNLALPPGSITSAFVDSSIELVANRGQTPGTVGIDSFGNAVVPLNLGANTITVNGPWLVTTPWPAGPMSVAPGSESVFGVDSDGYFKMSVNGAAVFPLAQTQLCIASFLAAVDKAASVGNCQKVSNAAVDQTIVMAGHSADLLTQIASIGSTPLYASAPAGVYEISVYVESVLSCVTPGPAALTITIGFTDDIGATTQSFSPVSLGVPSGRANASLRIYKPAAGNINYSTTLTACTSGTATYDLHLRANNL